MTTAYTKRSESAGIAWAPTLWIGGLHLGALLALVPAYFTWGALAVCLVLYWLTAGLGICLTYHRLLTHRSFATRPRWLEYILSAVGCCASEGGPVGWVADHRKHHANADGEDDVHSPNRGFRWAHLLWWIMPDVAIRHTTEYLRRWAPDLYRDPVHRFLDRFHFMGPERMKPFLLAESPTAFRRRMIMIEAEPLRRVRMPRDGRWWAYDEMRSGLKPEPGEVLG